MLQFVLLGLATGGLYAIGALGIVAIYRGSRTLNLAHGAIATWGAYIFVQLRDEHDAAPLVAAAVSLAAAATFGALVYLIVIRPLRHRTPVTKMVATIGVLVVLQTLAAQEFGETTVLVRSSFSIEPVDILGATISQDRLILVGIAVVTTALLATWSGTARFPLATRAMAENETAAVALGRSPHVLGAVNWALGCALAAFAGVLLVPILGLGPNSVGVIVVPALAAALLGRFDSYWLALAGGMLLGVAESLCTRYIDTPGWGSAAPLVLVVGALLLRRQRGANRLERQIAVPVASGAFRPVVVAVATVAAVGLVAVASNLWLDAAIRSFAYVLLALSLVVLIGYANQISLAQMSFAGVGAFAAVKVSIAWGLPFLLAPVVGAVVAAFAGVLIGLPALRIRGVDLAVVTLCAGLAAERILFQNPAYGGGLAGLHPETPAVFGARVDAIGHPQWYALVCLGWVGVGLAAVWALRRSGMGRRLLAMRTNERAASALGVNVAASKIVAFAVASALAGAAGVLLAYRQPTVTFGSFSFLESVNLVTIAVVAGVGAIGGGVLAGLLVAGGLAYRAIEQLGLLTGDYTTVFGIAVILTVIFRPQGLAMRRRPRRDHVRVVEEAVNARTPSALDVHGMTVAYGGITAVDGVSLRVEPGQIVGLVGPNGAGKTTLLDALGGFARARQGRVTLGGHDVSRAAAHRRARAGMGRVFQGLELFEDLTVAQNLLVGSEGAGQSGHRLSESAREVVEHFGLTGDLDRYPGELPLARRRIAAVARTLAGNPSVLLLDEPAAGLSGLETEALGEELRRLVDRTGIGVLLVDHDMSLVMSVCDRVVVLTGGRPLFDGTPEAVAADQQVRAAYLGDLAVATGER